MESLLIVSRVGAEGKTYLPLHVHYAPFIALNARYRNLFNPAETPFLWLLANSKQIITGGEERERGAWVASDSEIYSWITPLCMCECVCEYVEGG